jgi:hypothetical protein
MDDDVFSAPTEMDVIREVYPLYFPPEFGWGSVLDDHRFVVTAQLFCEFFKRREGDELIREVCCGYDAGNESAVILMSYSVASVTVYVR